MSMRHRSNEALPARGASIVPDHLCRDCRLINKHKTQRFEDRLLGFQRGARGSNVRTILLRGAERFF